MMNGITKDQAGALASLVATLRTDWDTPGILKAISDARHRGDAYRVAHAALYAAENAEIRTPAVIALAGPHWARGVEMGTDPIRYERCKEPGHGSYPASNCGACRADEIATTTPRTAPALGDRDAYARGAHEARAAITRAANHERGPTTAYQSPTLTRVPERH